MEVIFRIEIYYAGSEYSTCGYCTWDAIKALDANLGRKKPRTFKINLHRINNDEVITEVYWIHNEQMAFARYCVEDDPEILAKFEKMLSKREQKLVVEEPAEEKMD